MSLAMFSFVEHQFLHYFRGQYEFMRETAHKLLGQLHGCEVVSDTDRPLVVVHCEGLPLALVELVPEQSALLLQTALGTERWPLSCLGQQALYSGLLRVTERLQDLL